MASAGKPFAIHLETLMAELGIADGQLATALLDEESSFGLRTSLVKRIGEWRRGQSTPQNAAKVHGIETALKALATERGLVMPAGSLRDAWVEQRKKPGPEVRPLHTAGRTIQSSGREGDGVRLTGLVTDRRPKGGLCFFDVLDPTSVDVIQIAAQRDVLGEKGFGVVKSLQRGNRVAVTGRLSPNRAGSLVVWLTEPPVIQEAISNVSLATAAPEQRRVAAAVVTAAIRSAVDACFRRCGFLQMGTRILSSAVEVSNGLKPLVANYPGFGTPAVIAPSPSPQLVDAIVVSGADRVYCTSSCFTTTYRDDLDGVETDLVMGKALNASFAELVVVIEDVLTSVAECLGRPAWDRPARNTSKWPQLVVSGAGYPEIVTASIPGTVQGDPDTLVLRVHLTEACAPIEGSIEPFSSATTIGTLSVFPNRFLSIAEHAPIRRLQPL